MALRGCLLFALLLVFGSAGGQSAGISERRAVVAAASRYVGIVETGQNRGQPYTLFMQPAGYGPGTMWCGLFCHRVFQDAAVLHGIKGPAVAANWSVPASAVVWRFGRSVANKPPPKSGDLALFTFGGKRIRHIELIVQWPEGAYCWVIGGNTSNPANSKQEGVFAKKRLKTEMIVVSRIWKMYG